MFYTLQEVLTKLGKTEPEIKVLVREGKLREFRDGTKQLYKTEDVDALAAAPKGDSVVSDSLQISIDENADVSLAPEEIDALMGDNNKKNESKFKLDETGELLADEALDKPNKDETTLLPAETKKGEEIDLSELEKTDTKASQPPKKSGSTAGGTDILAGTKTGDSKISLSGESINVLGESDTEFKISDDTSGETKVVAKKPKALDEKGKDEASAARLDDDVNLEGIGGSGSGLLDLSLQADDTSLGAVLDDIYPESPAAAPAAEQTPAAPSGAVAEEAEKIFGETEPQPAIEQAATPETMAAAYIAEPPPDAASSTYGIILFMPLAALIYTSIVVISGYKPILNLKILSSIEPLIWYVIGGCAGLVLLIALFSLFMGGGGPKKPKPPKPPKEKKVKKDKKAKKEKEAPAKEG